MARTSDRGRSTTTRVNTDIDTNITRRPGASATPSNTKGTAKIASGLNILMGIWLVISPWILGHSIISAALWNDTIVGILVAVVAAIRFVTPLKMPALSWVNVLLGVWLILAPFVLNYSGGTAESVGTTLWADVIAGSVVVVLSLLSIDSSSNART